MTKEQFKKTVLHRDGGMFIFRVGGYDGMVGISPGSSIIWLDDGTAGEDDEPKFFCEFSDIDEMLSTFKVDGSLFADTILPQITELTRVLT